MATVSSPSWRATMARGNRRRRADARYLLTFVGTAGLLVSGTLVLVLYVLPERYVLSSGFVEGNLNLPDPTIPFEPVAPRLGAALPPAPAPDTTVVRGPAEIFWEPTSLHHRFLQKVHRQPLAPWAHSGRSPDARGATPGAPITSSSTSSPSEPSRGSSRTRTCRFMKSSRSRSARKEEPRRLLTSPVD